MANNVRRRVRRPKKSILKTAPADGPGSVPPIDPWDFAEAELAAAVTLTKEAAEAAAAAEWQALQAEHAARWALIEAEGLVQVARAQYEAARGLARADSDALADELEAEDAAYQAGTMQLLDSQDEVFRARQRQRN